MEHSRETIAMLIDADNSPSDKIDFILSEMAKYGVVNIRRAYGNWKSHSLKGWENKLHDYAIRPIQQFDYTKGKNATDMAMTIDAMDLLYSKKLDAFCIVSSDSDFTPLVMRILSEGLNVYGFGQKSAPAPFVNACSTFLYVESFGGGQEKSRNDGGRRRSGQQLKSDSKLLNLLRNAVDSVEEEDGWSNLAKIGKHISNQASFDPRNYGFKRLSDLIRSIDLFEIEFRNNNSELYIREKSKARKPDGGSSEGSGTSAESESPDSHRDAPQQDSFEKGDRERLSRPTRYRQPSHEQQPQSADGQKALPEPEGDKAAESRTLQSSQVFAKPEPASSSVAGEASQKSDALEAVVSQAESEKPADAVASAKDSGSGTQPEPLVSEAVVREPEASEAEAAKSSDSKDTGTEAPASKQSSRSRSTTARSGARKSVTRTTRKASSAREVVATGTEAQVSFSAPAIASTPQTADPNPVAKKVSETAVTESAAEQPEAAETKPKTITRRRTTKPRTTSSRKTKAATAKDSEGSRSSDEGAVATAASVEASAETPEAEKKPKRTTRRRTTRKKSEPETPPSEE